MFSSEEYESVGGGYRPTGRRKRTWNGIELRRRAEIENLFGRYGTIRGWPVLMCWNWPDRMSELLNRVVEKLTVPHDAILTCGETEMGLIRDYLTIEAS
ncbi:MAG: hypothetical protein LC104_01645 [Bacteroidales bacterium]|nr:hypothetical protein [Bacteroidales bacterium]